MTEFWEASFRDKQTMWGFGPADAAISTVDLFRKKGLKKILIPGFGYGRNAKIFTDHGFEVTGIEISETAINLAKKHYGDTVIVYHGNVSDMPFDQKSYDGIFCYALIHLLNDKERAKLIEDCYNQLRPGGYMVFTAISKNTPTYGDGTALGKDWYETRHGVKLFYYGPESVDKEFGRYGLLEAKEINEPAKNTENRSSQRFWEIICKKQK
ncbi:methyltransferase domain-containing protein [Sinomicrobium pectinilyticum]|uniref:Methyltransferase domain-containing protein n=1 Tax=Sinomicrobium pectinilyticum TaxID=1084421 RepID=A0A3N0DRW2_SINP1|nr:class I SAM-dependent methyltransferase [Sinomicrobium pectinilyticum]RNL78216.1 methyltransferase domain-containing protein [Sinomicrobium pectinilyticum]